MAWCGGSGCETISRAVVGSDGARQPSAAMTAAGHMNGADDRAAALSASLPGCEGARGCLSVMTYNLKHRDVPVQLHAVAKHMQSDPSRLADFILLQEVVFDRPRSKGHDNTAAALAELLGYQVKGAARDGGMEGVAILSRHPFAFADHRHLQSRDSLMSGGFPRVSLMGEFDVDGVGRVRVVNVHLTQRPSQSDIRGAQLQETLSWAAERQREAPADVIILGGDFNIEPGWSELDLMRDSAACGGMVFGNFNTDAPTSGKVGDVYQRVDYLFIAAPQREITHQGEAILWPEGIPTVDGKARFWPSDHLPLLHLYNVAGNS